AISRMSISLFISHSLGAFDFPKVCGLPICLS
ncbi:MAG: hypothetical protein ACI9XO_004139, partial [Paraglaciecola sp.]